MDPAAGEMPPSAPLHALFVVDEDVVHRFGTTIRQLAVGFVDESIRVTILGPAGLDVEPLLVGAAKRVPHASLRWPLRNRTLRAVVDALGADEPDVIHAMSGRTVELARAVAEPFELPLIVQLTGRDEIAAIEAAREGEQTRYIAISGPLLEAARQALGDQADRATLVHPGIHARKGRACFSDSNRTTTILSLTRFHGQHGLDPFLEAIRDLIESGRELMVFLMGTGPLEPEIRRRVISLGLLKTVTLTGPVTNRLAALDAVDILVSTRPQSELRVQPLEAMAAGVAIVAARGGVDDYMIDEQTALLFDPASPAQLGLQLGQLLEHQDLARRLAAAAQEHVRHRHQPSAMVASVVQLYRRLALKQRTVKLRQPS